jgi:predicted dehydrogenase
MNVEEFRKREISRRQFLGRSAQNAAGMAVGAMGLAGAVAHAAPGERVNVAVLGVRGQGKFLAATLAAFPDVRVAALCDVDENILTAASREVEDVQHAPPRREHDFRRVLDDPAIDAVVIATPDHWHAIMTILACQAGKDVYVEKPVSHNILEGERMVAAAGRYGRIVQTGLQQRSGSHFQSAVELVRSGKLGDVGLAKAWTVHKRKPVGHKPDAPPPQGVDYDLWLGPAPERPFNPNRFHHNWHWFWDYGTGEMGNWGVHMLDVARWGLGVELPSRVSAAGGKQHLHDDHETPDTLVVNYTFEGASAVGGGRSAASTSDASAQPPLTTHHSPLTPHHSPLTLVWEHRLWSNHTIEGRSTGVAFYGEHGTLVVDRGGWKVYDLPETLTSDSSEQPRTHLRDFIDCVKSRRPPIAGIETGHVSTTLCHLGNIAYRLGREVHFDPQAVSFATDAAANALLGREYRRPWELPPV